MFSPRISLLLEVEVREGNIGENPINERAEEKKKDGAAKSNKEMKRVGKRQKGEEAENGEGSERGRVGRWRGMREGARVSSRQQLIKSYSNWFNICLASQKCKTVLY